jgi:hypothetical protein
MLCVVSLPGSRVALLRVLALLSLLPKAPPLPHCHRVSHGKPLAASHLISGPALMLVVAHPALVIMVLPPQDLLGKVLLKRITKCFNRYTIIFIYHPSVPTTSYRAIQCWVEVPVDSSCQQLEPAVKLAHNQMNKTQGCQERCR